MSEGTFLRRITKSAIKKMVFDILLSRTIVHCRREALLEVFIFKKKPQGKLVSVIDGRVIDVAVDLRPDSKTFGCHEAVLLSGHNRRQLFVPPGFAHGFSVISKTAEFSYKCTDYYDPNDEAGIIWNDPDLAIDWRIENPSLSDKDKELMTFADYRRQVKV